MVKALDVGRQQGTVVVDVAAGLRAEATRTTGLLQVDAGELPEALRRQAWTFSYRYAAVPIRAGPGRGRGAAAGDGRVAGRGRLEPERLTLDVTAVYNIERAGIFKLELDVPAGYRAAPRPRLRPARRRRPRGGRRAGGLATTSKARDKDRLVVNLSHKAIGRVALAVQLQKDLREPTC